MKSQNFFHSKQEPLWYKVLYIPVPVFIFSVSLFLYSVFVYFNLAAVKPYPGFWWAAHTA